MWSVVATAVGRVVPASLRMGPWCYGAEDPPDVVALEGLVLHERGGQVVERPTVLGQDGPGDRVGAVDEHPHLVVDAGRDLLGVVRRRGEVAAEEHLSLGMAEPAGPELRRSCRTP